MTETQASNEQLQIIKEKIDNLSGKPKVSQVTREMIQFIQDTPDPLLATDKKAKAANPYKKRKGI